MENAKNFNVFNKISKGEHICRGDKLYTREEIQEMLVRSGLNSLDIELLYDLNAEDALAEAKKMAGDDFLDIQPEETIYLSNEGWTVRQFFLLERRSGFLHILIVFQLVLFGLIAGILRLKGVASSKEFLLPLALLLLSYGLAVIASAFLEPIWGKEAKNDASIPEGALRSKMKEVVVARQEVLNSVCNTFHMYECMWQAINDENVREIVDTVSEINVPEDNSVDDLK